MEERQVVYLPSFLGLNLSRHQFTSFSSRAEPSGVLACLKACFHRTQTLSVPTSRPVSFNKVAVENTDSPSDNNDKGTSQVPIRA